MNTESTKEGEKAKLIIFHNFYQESNAVAGDRLSVLV